MSILTLLLGNIYFLHKEQYSDYVSKACTEIPFQRQAFTNIDISMYEYFEMFKSKQESFHTC